MKPIRPDLGQMLLAVALALAVPAWAGGDGLSFFQRFVVVEGGVTRLRSVRSAELPPARGALLACEREHPEDKRDTCLDLALALLEREWQDATHPDVKAGHALTAGIVHAQRLRWEQALEWLARAAGEAEAPLILGPALHWKLHLDLQLGHFPAVIHGLDRLAKDTSSYGGLPVEFSTWSLHFCKYGGGQWCHRPLPLDGFLAQRGRLEQAVSWGAVIEAASTGTSSRRALATSLVELGRTYESLCPSDSFFAVVCPDALDLYQKAYPALRDEPGVDYAMFQIQRSKFSYEYEGNDRAWSEDAVRNYGAFLEEYPDSPHAPEARREFERAQAILDRDRASGSANAE